MKGRNTKVYASLDDYRSSKYKYYNIKDLYPCETGGYKLALSNGGLLILPEGVVIEVGGSYDD